MMSRQLLVLASITKFLKGRREVVSVGPDRKRRTVRLGKVDQKAAGSTRLRIEKPGGAASAAPSSRPPPSGNPRPWGDALHDRLVRAGLCKPNVAAPAAAGLPLANMVNDCIARRDDDKPATRAVYRLP
jgi:hypothetical protein